ncbi:hypothetical protein AAKU55_003608 [Oxalobacteraceae bacterium GrIS 1.11]
MQQQATVSSDKFDGSPAHILRFMRELVELTGQGTAGDCPVLELQFDEVVTKTSLHVGQAAPFLCIAVYLPRRTLAPSVTPSLAGTIFADKSELLWDAGDGRYVILHKIGIDCLPDERSLFDAILDAKDRAVAWQASVGATAGK